MKHHITPTTAAWRKKLQGPRVKQQRPCWAWSASGPAPSCSRSSWVGCKPSCTATETRAPKASSWTPPCAVALNPETPGKKRGSARKSAPQKSLSFRSGCTSALPVSLCYGPACFCFRTSLFVAPPSSPVLAKAPVTCRLFAGRASLDSLIGSLRSVLPGLQAACCSDCESIPNCSLACQSIRPLNVGTATRLSASFSVAS